MTDTWDKCPKTRKVQPWHTDRRGTRAGKMTVIGLSRKRHPERALWVCRCDCGNYQIRQSHDIKKDRNQMCTSCWDAYMSEIRRREADEDVQGDYAGGNSRS